MLSIVKCFLVQTVYFTEIKFSGNTYIFYNFYQIFYIVNALLKNVSMLCECCVAFQFEIEKKWFDICVELCTSGEMEEK